MTSQNRSAGYCVHCQRGVTVVHPSNDGLFGRVRDALTSNEETWICSKCGNPASKGFPPPIEAPATKPEETTLTIEKQHVVVDNPTPVLDQDTMTSNLNNSDDDPPEMFTVASGPEAICHLCNVNIPFKLTDYSTLSTCPECQGAILLPASTNESLLTSSPAIIKLEDDPERPAISKSICTLCQFEMTYPKKLTGKDVDCPSCETHFQLP